MSADSRSYEWYRRTYKDISGELVLGTGDGDTTLVAALTLATIFIQRIVVHIVTSAAQTLSFESGTGGSGTPVIYTVEASVAAGVTREIDFGARGKALDEAEAFFLDVGAAGVGAVITWEGYAKLTGVGAPQTSGGV